MRGLGLGIPTTISHWIWTASGEGTKCRPNSSFWPVAITGEELNYDPSETNINVIWRNECLDTEGELGGTPKHPQYQA